MNQHPRLVRKIFLLFTASPIGTGFALYLIKEGYSPLQLQQHIEAQQNWRFCASDPIQRCAFKEGDAFYQPPLFGFLMSPCHKFLCRCFDVWTWEVVAESGQILDCLAVGAELCPRSKHSPVAHVLFLYVILYTILCYINWIGSHSKNKTLKSFNPVVFTFFCKIFESKVSYCLVTMYFLSCNDIRNSK